MSRATKRARRQHLSYVLAGGTLLVIAICIVGAVMYFGREDRTLQVDARLCPVDGPKGHVVMLVDMTDPLSFTQNAAFKERVRELVEEKVIEGYLLSIFTLGEDFKETALPIASFCNPGTGKSRTEWNANLKRLRERYESGFKAPILKLTQDLVAGKPAKYSPIAEMLQLVGINAFQKERVTGPRKLVVFSDMLHNTPQLSMFHAMPDFSAFASTDYGRKSIANLPGVEVELNYLILSPKLQTKRNLKFWEEFFDKAGARVVEVRPLEG